MFLFVFINENQKHSFQTTKSGIKVHHTENGTMDQVKLLDEHSLGHKVHHQHVLLLTDEQRLVPTGVSELKMYKNSQSLNTLMNE